MSIVGIRVDSRSIDEGIQEHAIRRELVSSTHGVRFLGVSIVGIRVDSRSKLLLAFDSCL